MATYKGFPKEWPPIKVNPFDDFDAAYRNVRDGFGSINDLRRILVRTFEDIGPIDVKKDFGAKVDGVTNDATALQTAIDNAKGDVHHIDGVLAIASTVTLKSGVKIRLGAGATIKWTGAAGGTMFDTPVTDILLRTGIVGGIIDMADAGVYLDPHCCLFSEWGHHQILGTRTTSIVLRLSADSTAGTPPSGLARHFAFNRIHDIRHDGDCGTFLHCRINTSIANQGFFGNSFHDLEAFNIQNTGIRLTGVDNNIFFGHIRVQLDVNNTTGVVFEKDTVATRECTENCFQYLNVDSFLNLPGTNRVGISMEDASDMNRIFQYVAGGTGITNSLSIASTVRAYSIYEARHVANKQATIRQDSGSGTMQRWTRTGGPSRLALRNAQGGSGTEIGRLEAEADDSLGNDTVFALLEFFLDTNTDGSEDGGLNLKGLIAGTDRFLAKFGVNGYLTLGDGVGQPPTITGLAQIFVASGDGDLKIVFGDGTVKTIVVDT